MLVKNLKKQKGFEDWEISCPNKTKEHLLGLNVHPQVIKLLEIPQWGQRSPEWYEQRKNKITASDIDAVLGRSKYANNKPVDILFKKCGLVPPFKGNDATRHGQKYEDEAIEHYCKRFNKKVFDFGLLPHETIKCIGGSPDGITWDGIVIEVKCPLTRTIKMGEIPSHYLSQILINMEIANLDKGVFIEYVPEGFRSPDQKMELNIVHIDRDFNWFVEVRPLIEDFWKQVEKYRREGIHTHKKYKKYKEKYNPTCLAEPEGFCPSG